MAEFKISRIAYTWKGDWEADIAYVRDDVIRYNGKSYVCIRQHTAAADFYYDLYYTVPGETTASPAWVQMTDGFSWRGTWFPGTKYGLGDIVRYGGSLYACIDDNTASDFDTQISSWTVYADSWGWTGDWETGTQYGIGDVVKYNGIVYRCVEGHTASSVSSGLESDQAKWEVVHSGVEFKGNWAQDTRYRVNDLVKYGGTIFKCNTGHTSATTLNDDYWDVELRGTEFEGEWDASVQYNVGDVVRAGGFVYYALKNNTNSDPGNLYYSYGTSDWQILSKAQRLRGDWSSLETYQTGDLVRRGGNLYVALSNTTSDGSSLDYLDAGNWELVTPSQNWRNFWATGEIYAVGDIVLFDGTAYQSNYEHESSTENYPGDNGNGYNFWDIVLLAGPGTGLSQHGDLLTYDLSRRITGDQSTFEVTNVAIGERDQLLSIDSEDSLIYSVYGSLQNLYYVKPEGIDDVTDPERGKSIFKPWKTVRYACEQVDVINSPGYNTIKVWPGTYEEILPIIVPARTAIVGEEVRAVTIVAAGPVAELALDSTYTKNVLGRLSSIIPALFTGTEVTPSAGNTTEQVFLSEDRVASIEASSDVQTLILNVINYIDFYINSTGEEPELVGTNTAITDDVYLNAIEILELNADFLADEAVAYMQVNHPTYSFNADLCKRDVKAYLSAFKYDLLYTGNYKTILAARYYRNAVLGCEGEDMFYVRDATGIRNMTLRGLAGEMNPPNIYDLYQRPTGGSYVSLDPGWGPDDERVWINTRSCYVQNCCTFGYACTGQKIDGALHNGGYKSIVSNDFTQVISDGIGAYVLNNGRAELVSVFTYYAQVGYLAEAGGKIRATNGNNSYGVYGSLATGNDPTETPTYATVNTRNQDAIVADAFAGEVNDEIMILQYANAGQNYTEATYTFVGSGVGADAIQDEFRDDAVFEVRVVNAPDSASPGGGGYTLIGNNAQAGDLYTITIASNDENEPSQLIGMRLIITSGDGTGQYGYIQDYNSTSKVATIYRESDDQPGWDHVTPGWPLVNPITTSATYRIEPRLTFSDPGFEADTTNLQAGTTWTSIAYGETTETYVNIEGTSGTGTVVEDDGLTPAPATFDVVKNGRTYSVTINEAGAGYAVGDELVITGDYLGGVTPDNDLTITVLTTSDDSTNSILTFEHVGIGASGRFVAAAGTGNTASHSIDGRTWTLTTMPSNGVWKSMAAGGNKFVAIRNASNAAASSLDGITWTARTMPASRNWNAVTYGADIFVAVAGNLNAGAISTNGTTWASTTLPTAGDSSYNEWVDITYGKEKFVAIANSGNICAVGEWNGSSMSWTAHIMDVIDDSSAKDWVSVAYGNNRFVAMSAQGDVAYSFNGTVWYPATMPTPDGSTIMHWNKMKYAQGVFFAVCDTAGQAVSGDTTSGPTTYCATSYDGIVWTNRELATSQNWTNMAFGNPDVVEGDSTVGDSKGTWVVITSDVSNAANYVYTGARTLARAIVEAGRISQIKIWEPGSGYSVAPDLTIFDANNTGDAFTDNRLGDGVLAQPSWINRGVGYKTSTTRVTISGNGFADVLPLGGNITLSNLERYPGPGAQLRFSGSTTIYTVVTIDELGKLGGYNDGFSATFRVNPTFGLEDYVDNGTTVEIRERYSQCRITGHDFLDIGTGNFDDTNYPLLYSTGDFLSAPENEIVEANGGRVFYTSTDQSGNFRTGELFAVEQASGIVTISADFFQLDGLTELALGGVRLGGSGAVIREFSTDPLFTADSNNVVPTQRAIKAYLQNRLSVGGAELTTASFIAGTVRVGPNLISSTISGTINIAVPTNFDETAEISGSIVAQSMFFKSFNDDPSRV